MTHTLGKNWKIFLGRDVHFGKSTDQQESARYTLFFSFLVTELELGNQHINKDMTHTLVKIWVLFSVNVGQDGKSTHQQESARNAIFLLSLLQFPINKSTRKWHTHWVKFEKFSREEMVILVNQRINRNLRTIPYFSDFRAETLTLGNQRINKDMTHTLVKIWVLFSVKVGQDEKSTHQQESAHNALFFFCLLQFLINKSTRKWHTHWVKIEKFLGQRCSFW